MPRIQWKPATLLASVGIAVALMSCGDPVAPASFPNPDNKFAIYAMSGTPANAPSALGIRFALPATIDANLAFDAAFDITDDGKVSILSIRKIANQLVPVQRVGFQTTTQSFDAIQRAPANGYTFDSLLVVPVGQTVLMNLVEVTCVNTITGFNIYGKLVVDSLDLDTRAIYLHVLSDPNCGFETLTPGIPKD